MKNNIPAIELFLYRHGTGFQAYRHDFLYRQADQKFALAVTKWNNNILATSLFMYWHCTQPMKHTGKTCCTGMPIPSRMCATWCSRSGSCHGMAGTGMVARESASVPWQGSVLLSTGHLIVLASMICQIHMGCRYNLQYYCICLYNTRIPQPTNVHGHVITGTVLFKSASSTRNIYCAGEVLKHKQMYWKPLQCLHHQYQHVIPVTNLFGYCVLAPVVFGRVIPATILKNEGIRWGQMFCCSQAKSLAFLAT